MFTGWPFLVCSGSGKVLKRLSCDSIAFPHLGAQVWSCRRLHRLLPVRYGHRAKNLISAPPGRISMHNRHLNLIVALTATVLVTCSARSQSADPLAFHRAEHLRHGINTSDWFLPVAQRLLRPAAANIRHRRRHPDSFAGWASITYGSVSTRSRCLRGSRIARTALAFMAELDAIVKVALDQKLAVIIDLHPESRYKQTLLQGAESGPTLSPRSGSRSPVILHRSIQNLSSSRS
jgi:hypothetical protein